MQGCGIQALTTPGYCLILKSQVSLPLRTPSHSSPWTFIYTFFFQSPHPAFALCLALGRT